MLDNIAMQQLTVSTVLIQIQGQALMKVTSHKSIPSIDRKPNRKFKNLTNVNIAQSLTFRAVSQLIFKAQILPFIIELQTSQCKQLTFMMNQTNATIKCEQEVSSIAAGYNKQKWIRIVLGSGVRRVELKSYNSQGKIDKNGVYATLDQWKGRVREQPKNIHHFYLVPLLGLLRTKLENKQKLVQISSKNSIGSFIKTKLSERNTFRNNLNNFRNRQDFFLRQTQTTQNQDSRTYQILDKRQNQTEHNEMRIGSNTIDTNRLSNQGSVAYHNIPSHLKESNTSTAISGQHDIKFHNRRIRRFKDLTADKITKSQKQTHLIDHSEIYQSKSNQRPKFYQHFNISQQEIDKRRTKFDSQFIYQKDVHPQTTKEIYGNESEVTQDICKVENSRVNIIEDTFEKGFEGNKPSQVLDESGTLYESVYQ